MRITEGRMEGGDRGRKEEIGGRKEKGGKRMMYSYRGEQRAEGGRRTGGRGGLEKGGKERRKGGGEEEMLGGRKTEGEK